MRLDRMIIEPHIAKAKLCREGRGRSSDPPHVGEVEGKTAAQDEQVLMRSGSFAGILLLFRFHCKNVPECFPPDPHVFFDLRV